jgi:hypothetical protein
MTGSRRHVDGIVEWLHTLVIRQTFRTRILLYNNRFSVNTGDFSVKTSRKSPATSRTRSLWQVGDDKVDCLPGLFDNSGIGALRAEWFWHRARSNAIHQRLSRNRTGKISSIAKNKFRIARETRARPGNRRSPPHSITHPLYTRRRKMYFIQSPSSSAKRAAVVKQ